MDKLLRPKEVAEHLNVSVDEARKLMKGMRCVNMNGSATHPRLQVAESDLTEWLESRKQRNGKQERHKTRVISFSTTDGFEPDGRLKRRKA